MSNDIWYPEHKKELMLRLIQIRKKINKVVDIK